MFMYFMNLWTRWLMYALVLFASTDYMQVCVGRSIIEEFNACKRDIQKLQDLADTERIKESIKTNIKRSQNKIDQHHKGFWASIESPFTFVNCHQTCNQFDQESVAGVPRQCYACQDTVWPIPQKHDFLWDQDNQGRGRCVPYVSDVDDTASIAYGPYYRYQSTQNELHCGLYPVEDGELNHALCSEFPDQWDHHRLCWCTQCTQDECANFNPNP